MRLDFEKEMYFGYAKQLFCFPWLQDIVCLHPSAHNNRPGLWSFPADLNSHFLWNPIRLTRKQNCFSPPKPEKHSGLLKWQFWTSWWDCSIWEWNQRPTAAGWLTSDVFGTKIWSQQRNVNVVKREEVTDIWKHQLTAWPACAIKLVSMHVLNTA